VTDHFNGKKFLNPGGIGAKGFSAVLRWMLTRKKGEWKAENNPVAGPRPLTHFNDGIRITFVNHSTFLIQVAGLNILTDPVWSHRASPFSWLGPARLRPPGVRLDDLPHIHLVLLSHNHYDHLDIKTLRIIFGAHHPEIITPLGVKALLDKSWIRGSKEIDWWEEVVFSDKLKVVSVPAVHFSGRGMLDRDASLWCGYVIHTPTGNIFFAGDTGYHKETFAEIGRRSAPLRVSLLPVGAYKPEWFMSSIHVSPAGAVEIFRDLGTQAAVASHFGTFQLADEGKEELVAELKNALQAHNISEERFILLPEGQPIIFG
jgi:L-ascorbate metabolism protein UlaG (beta-lactamase superfamily)